MENPSPAADLLWEEQLRAYKAQAGLERREWLRRFALVFVCIALTLAAAAGLAGLVKTP
jgi:lipopolysaccharide export LptBFGC system permease protein LptF